MQCLQLSAETQMTLLVSSESKHLVWIGTGCGNVSAQSCFYWWLNGIDDEDGHEDDDNNDKHDNNVDNNDNDDDDDDDDSHPAPCNNRGSSVATLASPGISQMRLLCFIDNTPHTALVLDFLESTLLHKQQHSSWCVTIIQEK